MSTTKRHQQPRVPTMKTFSERLQHVASIKKMFQADLVAALGKDKGTINKWWNGGVVPGPRNMSMLADYFGCDLHWLETGEGEPFPKLQTEEPLSEFQARRAEKCKEVELDSLAKMRFKLQRAPVYFEDFFDFIFEMYGDDQEAVEKFLSKLYESHANYRIWLNEKKQTDRGAVDKFSATKSVNGED